MLALVQIPEHGSCVLTTRCTERSIRRDGDGVDVAGVTNVVGTELAVVQVPHLDDLVPTTRYNDGHGRVRRESHAGNPFLVTIFDDGELAFTQSIPELDGLVSGARNNLAVISREGDREDISLVADKAAGGGSSAQVPKTKGLIPGSRESKLSIRGDDNVFNEVIVAVKRLLGESIVDIIAGQVPYQHSLIARRGQQDVRVASGGDGGNPT